MKLGLSLGNVMGSSVHEQVALAQAAERLGYSVVWAAEAYGCDAPTLLSYIAASTERIDIGAAVMQIPARTPAMTAMTAATLDLLSGGRFRLGLGVSGPQVSEGWHGVRFDRPLSRTREYVEVVEAALQRRVVHHEGEFFPLPLPDGPGKALRLSVRPARDRLPIYLGAVGPRNVRLAAEIADGWLAIFASARYVTDLRDELTVGRRTSGSGARPFDIAATVPAVLGDDLETCADQLRGHAALYLGGMGSRQENFYNRLAQRMGFGDAAKRVQDLFLDGRLREAGSAVPLDFIDQTSLIGPSGRLAERLHAYAAAGVTTLCIATSAPDLQARKDTLQRVSEVFEGAGLAD